MKAGKKTKTSEVADSTKQDVTILRVMKERDDWKHSCEVNRELALKLEQERDAYKKAKEENDERFMLERDNAIALAAGDRLRFEAEKKALVIQAEELSAIIKAKASPAESCLEERQRGRGGCGCCAVCCKELKDQLEAMTAKWNGASLAAQKLGEEAVAASKVELTLKRYNGVLDEIHAERMRQDSKWGEQNHPDGTGGPNARNQADAAKAICAHYAKRGELTWMQILTEEMLEAFAETDEEKLVTELVQSAAVATAWVEAIRRRQHGRPG